MSTPDPWVGFWRADVILVDDVDKPMWEPDLENSLVHALTFGLAIAQGSDVWVYPWRRIRLLRMREVVDQVEGGATNSHYPSRPDDTIGRRLNTDGPVITP